MSGKVIKVAGPLVVAEGLADANVSDVVRVGPQHLIGEHERGFQCETPQSPQIRS